MLAHRNGAIGPSMARMICPTLDLAGRFRKRIAARLAFLGMHEARAPEIREYLVEELFRYVIGPGDLRHLRNFIFAKPGKMKHRLQAILALIR